MAYGIPVKDEVNANYDLVTDLAPKIGQLKGYDYGYSLPTAGMFILQHKGFNFMITAELLSRAEDQSISDVLHANKFRFTNKVDDNKRREEAEAGESNG